MIEKAKCLETIEQTLSPKRRKHSLCVAQQAIRLAQRYGADPRKAEIAGLLHDVMKNLSKPKMLEEFARRGILLDPVTNQSPQLWHAVLGEAYVRDDLGETDPDILRGIRYHTTGRPGMTLFEKILYLADYTSDDRDYPDAGKMRRIVEQDLDAALREGLRYTIMNLAEVRRPVHPDSLGAYNEVLALNPPQELRL